MWKNTIVIKEHEWEDVWSAFYGQEPHINSDWWFMKSGNIVMVNEVFLSPKKIGLILKLLVTGLFMTIGLVKIVKANMQKFSQHSLKNMSNDSSN